MGLYGGAALRGAALLPPPPPPPSANRFASAIREASRASAGARSSGGVDQIADAAAKWGDVYAMAESEFRRAAFTASAGTTLDEAVEKKRQELLSQLSQNETTAVEAILDEAQGVVLGETPGQRRARVTHEDAQARYSAAAAEWQTAQGWTSAQREDSPVLEERHSNAEAGFLQAETDLLLATSDVVDADLDAKLHELYGDPGDGGYTPEQISGASDQLKIGCGGGSETGSLVDYRAAVLSQGQEMQDWLNRILDDPDSLVLTEADRRLADEDPVMLAFLKTSGVTLELDPARNPSLTAEEIALGEADPVLFAMMRLGDVRIGSHGNRIEVEIGGDTHLLTPEHQAAYQEGGVTGLAVALSGEIDIGVEARALIEASDPIRMEFAAGRLPALNDRDALDFVNTQLNGFFSPLARRAFWEDHGLPAVKPHLEESINNVRPEEGFETAYLTHLGDHLHGLLEGASQEVADLILDLTKARVDRQLPDDYLASPTNFMEALSKAVFIADQGQMGPRAEEFADWLVDSPRSLIDMNTPADFRQIIAHSGHTALGRALAGKLAETPGYIDGFAEEMGQAVTGGEQDFASERGELIRNQQYTDFMDPAVHVDLVNDFFNGFRERPGIGTPIGTNNTPELRNSIGEALGYAPTQNLDLVAGDDRSGDWYAEGTQERIYIDLIVSWINIEDDAGSTVTILPVIYASNRDGVNYGALFRVSRSDGSEAIIDGMAADDAVMAAAHRQGVDLNDPAAASGLDLSPNNMFVNWRYDGFQDFIDENHYDTDGQLYMPKDWRLQDRDGDGHVDWMEEDAARFTTGEKWKLGGDIAALVVGTAGGLLLAPVTGGGSLAATAAVWTAVGAAAGWGVYRANDTRNEVVGNGQTDSCDNPVVRDTYVQQGAAVFSFLPMGASSRAVWLTRSGTKLQALGQASRNAALVDQGASQFANAGRFGAAARWTGHIDTGVGVYFIGTQGAALAANWGGMSWGERAMGLGFTLFGIGQLGVGRIPGIAGFVADRSGLTAQDRDHIRSVDAARIASDADGPMAPEFGAYRRLPGGEVLVIPRAGDPIVIHPRPAAPDGGSRPASRDVSRPGGGATIRYAAHIDADGTPSLGLIGSDGQTTADIDAPWTGVHPAEVLVKESSTSPYGRVTVDAIHRLIRNEDGTYSGARLDADGRVSAYLTGGPGADHPLDGIQLRNSRPAADTRSEADDAHMRAEGAYPAARPDPAEFQTRETADAALLFSGMQLDDGWGIFVREVDPKTNDIQITELHENELTFFDPATRETFGRSPHDGTARLTFEDGARVYHPGTNREYVYSASSRRFEPLPVPDGAKPYYYADLDVTFLRGGDGTIAFFGRGDNTGKSGSWEPGLADRSDSPDHGAGWQYVESENRSYARGEDGRIGPLVPPDFELPLYVIGDEGAGSLSLQLAHYNSKENATYLVDLLSGRVTYFGRGDNRGFAPDAPGSLQRAGHWAHDKIGDQRLGVAVRVRTPTIDNGAAGTTISSAGRSISTKYGPGKPQKSDRFWEIRNAPLAFLFGYSSQEAFQFKGSTFVTAVENVMAGQHKQTAFNIRVVNIEDAGQSQADPERTVLELSLAFELKTRNAELDANEIEFFGARGPVGEVPLGIPFTKVMSETKASAPLWLRMIILERLGLPAEAAPLLGVVKLRPGVEDRPEIAISGLPDGAKLSERFLLQTDAALGQVRLKLQIATRNPDAVRAALRANPDLAAIASPPAGGSSLYDEMLVYVGRGASSGMRLSRVTDVPDRLRVTDLTGHDRDVMNPSQMNADVVFNTRASLDYWLDRALLWPAKSGTRRAIDAIPRGDRWSQSWLGRLEQRWQPQPHHQTGEGFYRNISGAHPAPQRRVTLSFTPISLPFGLFTVEFRGATKLKGTPDEEPKAFSRPGARDWGIVRIDDPDNGAVANVIIPRWLADLIETGQTGRGVLWPKGASRELEPLLNYWAAHRPDKAARIQDFRDTVLTKFPDGGYLSRHEVDRIAAFLPTLRE